MTEKWADIIGFEGKYQISNLGRVKSMSRIIEYKHTKMGLVKAVNPEVIMKQYQSVGYLKVDLYDNMIRKRVFVHRLIAEAFIPKIDGKTYVNHKNGDRQDNRIDNLEWCTQSENCLHAHNVLKPLGLTYNKNKAA